jgi:hypothetical protein
LAEGRTLSESRLRSAIDAVAQSGAREHLEGTIDRLLLDSLRSLDQQRGVFSSSGVEWLRQLAAKLANREM